MLDASCDYLATKDNSNYFELIIPYYLYPSMSNPYEAFAADDDDDEPRTTVVKQEAKVVRSNCVYSQPTKIESWPKKTRKRQPDKHRSKQLLQ